MPLKHDRLQDLPTLHRKRTVSSGTSSSCRREVSSSAQGTANLIIIAFVSALHSEVLLARKVAATSVGELWLKLILRRSGTTGALRLAAQSALLLIE